MDYLVGQLEYIPRKNVFQHENNIGNHIHFGVIDKETCIKDIGTCPLQLVMMEAVDQLKFPIIPDRTNP